MQTTTTFINRSPDAWNTTTTFFSRSTQSGIALKSNGTPIWFYGLVGVGVLVTLGVIMFVFCLLRRRRERVIPAVALPLQTFGEGSSDEELYYSKINNFNLKQNIYSESKTYIFIQVYS